MTLYEDWKLILKKAWTVRLALLAGALSGAEVVLPLFADVIPRGVFSGLSVLVAMAIPIARIVAQPNTLGDGP